MSRILAALIVGGLCFTALLPGGFAVSAESLGVSDTSTPVRLAARELKKPHDQPLTLPAKKPDKPVVRKAAKRKKSNIRKPLSRSVRDKQLCKALQACRNKFVWCKGKIKHPDQSKAWSIAKEVCGGHYKTCVEKDFKGGEWFFTRWFYFQKLDCS